MAASAVSARRADVTGESPTWLPHDPNALTWPMNALTWPLHICKPLTTISVISHFDLSDETYKPIRQKWSKCLIWSSSQSRRALAGTLKNLQLQDKLSVWKLDLILSVCLPVCLALSRSIPSLPIWKSCFAQNTIVLLWLLVGAVASHSTLEVHKMWNERKWPTH